ncbi:putative toxin-antitoxin system toxin component, PIN family [Halonotius roseus]|uniref:Putative toxin-antitoxin system toxin component, PIN family n=1 Tax=Halonotius roseus TaxID=2511997 RepID=A0A544QQ78_9EURY|nr:putative toxin-antitoxin system toxin component, PIN family [Halonotius roseus]TQQ81597.1 putative toxin-antitoxin system toxin component, PIN family [Halonotius roseus]
MGSLRVVFDTNVLVSAIGFGGKPWDCLVLAFVGDVEMVTAEAAIAEFERVLGYDRLPFTEAEREQYPALIRAEATVVDPDASIQVIDDDPDDDLFLEIALEAEVDYIVSGDPHLTDLGAFRDIDIVSPSEFLEESGEML